MQVYTPIVIFRIAIGLPLGHGEQGVLDVFYSGGRDLYFHDGKEYLTKDMLATSFVSLSKCLSSDCQTKQLLEELNASDVDELTGWVVSDSAAHRVSLCLGATAQDAAAHPQLAKTALFLNEIEATFKKVVED